MNTIEQAAELAAGFGAGRNAAPFRGGIFDPKRAEAKPVYVGRHPDANASLVQSVWIQALGFWLGVGSRVKAGVANSRTYIESFVGQKTFVDDTEVPASAVQYDQETSMRRPPQYSFPGPQETSAPVQPCPPGYHYELQWSLPGPGTDSFGVNRVRVCVPDKLTNSPAFSAVEAFRRARMEHLSPGKQASAGIRQTPYQWGSLRGSPEEENMDLVQQAAGLGTLFTRGFGAIGDVKYITTKDQGRLGSLFIQPTSGDVTAGTFDSRKKSAIGYFAKNSPVKST